MRRTLFSGLLMLALAPMGVLAQAGGQTTNDQAQTEPVNAGPGQTVPIYKVTVVGSTVPAINYRHRSGSTRLDFKGTSLLGTATGSAEVKSEAAATHVDAEFRDLPPASTLGAQYLTYVLWAITPNGHPVSLGEIIPNSNGRAHVNVSTPLQAFGLIVSAEPYFSVMRPSNEVVMENRVTPYTNGTVEEVDAKYELLKRGQYTSNVNPSEITPLGAGENTPLSVLEGQNAIRIAEWAGADQYASDTLSKAQLDLKNAQELAATHGDRHQIDALAREAAQTAEDARVIALNKIAEQQQAQDRDAAAQAQQQAQQAQQQAEQSSQAKAEADAAQAAALAQKQRAEAEAQRAQTAAQQAGQRADQADRERAQMRARLLNQLNTILRTRDTARGLVVNMPDVLFATGRYQLQPKAQLALAKISGVLLAYPGMTIEIDGYTDNVGSARTNDALSQKRADAVRDFLVQQGVSPSSISSRGFGEEHPVASNDTATGRSMNRRVNLVVTGNSIRTQTASVGGSR